LSANGNCSCSNCARKKPGAGRRRRLDFMAIPTSFDFDSKAIRPDYVVKCSYGNDSIALLQWLHEHEVRFGKLGKIVVLYNNTGWSAKWWPGRVAVAEKKLCEPYGFIPAQTIKFDWDKMLFEHNTWPDKMRRFCTQEAKIFPTMAWLSEHDPEGKATLLCGVRREESDSRANWPEFVESDSTNEGRPQWSPLVLVKEKQRNELITRAGYEVLPHRSRECRCIMANSSDLKTFSEEDILEIESKEALLGQRNRHRELTNKFMFHPHRFKGEPHGIRQVIAWAKTVKPKQAKNEEQGGCDSGYCTG
jgi:Phosphoadenosine phosphosulfate reductase family